jgi:hypothetical protein
MMRHGAKHPDEILSHDWCQQALGLCPRVILVEVRSKVLGFMHNGAGSTTAGERLRGSALVTLVYHK